MTKVSVKFEAATGLESQDLTSKLVSAALVKHIPDGLFLDINVRPDLTATVMIQDSFYCWAQSTVSASWRQGINQQDVVLFWNGMLHKW